MTRDAPSSIKDIELVDKILARANAVNDLGQSLIGGEVGEKENAVLLPFLSTKSQKQATKLLQELEGSFLASGQNALGDLEAVELITNIKQQTDSLASFLDDCISSLDTPSLRTLRKMASKAAQDLRHRIAMRLTLLTEEASPDQTRVDFDSQATPRQRLRMGHHSGDSVLVEYIYYEDIDEQTHQRLSQQVAKISALHVEPKDPSFRTLPGIGYLHDSLYGPRFGFIFKVPNDKIGWKPFLLSGILGKVKVPLETRYRLAHDICEALLQLHSIGWFHKNMKSDNVLIFSSNDQKSVNNRTEGRTEPVYDFERPYLIGFDCSRPEEAETRGTVDFDVDANIYRHPDRWGRPLRFTRQHDIYALGIVLMEIGMWRTLPSMDSAQKGFASVKDPERLRKFLLTSAMPRLAHATGSRYADAVRSCLDPGEWTNYENWEVHDSMRQKVLRPLKAAYEALAS
ncbi:hypothetical protein GCG54_00001172 [Colletotrichum gloeosporioides]|uniref:Protein kinase domain-containing protein n=1 Tax=Colletotrichum gloeosporioides TaxID=474922 RepID=A0A8H4FE72_COLGL|nr:uncharacterized protein GCG54_00001172 [Colletotrichum gloeosporioides]KAF3799068.1 hypothetical protein GCG54_00001172 [Colletotrichum gloeosporioides]